MNKLVGKIVSRTVLLLSMGVVLAAPGVLSAQSQWRIDVIDGGPGKSVGKFTSLAIDKDGNLHVGYYDETRQALRYGFRSAGKWYTMEVDASGGYESLAVDAQGQPHFAYAAPNEAGLRYAAWDGSKWNKQTLDAERIDFFNCIRIGPDGLPRISYYQRLHRDGSFALHLKYAHFEAKSKTWYTETVDARSATGKFNSLALDSKGLPYISYSDVDTGDLRYTKWDGSEWNFSAPDTQKQSDGWVGIGSSIELDQSGNPHIAYVDVTHHRIKYASWTGNSWKSEVVDTIMGKADNIDRISLKFDSRQRPHLAYWDSGLGVLRHATLTPKGWKAETVDNADNVGLYPSLAIDSSDELYISYYDNTNGVLRLAHKRPATQDEPQEKSAELVKEAAR